MALACLETFRAKWIELRCCRGVQHLPVRLIIAADQNRAARTLADFRIRLRCPECGSRAAAGALIQHIAKQATTHAGCGPATDWRLELIAL